jgi:hypothetical protein
VLDRLVAVAGGSAADAAGGRCRFNQALNIAFDNRLGLCQLESERQVSR